MPLLHKIAGVVVVCAVVLGLVLPGERRDDGGDSAEAERAGATAQAKPVDAEHGAARPGAAAATPPPGAPSAPPSASATAPIRAAAPAAAAAKANELGQVPVLMYHRILAKPEQSLDRSTKELYDELTRLAKGGYTPVTATEFASGRIGVPAGRHPVVLTFDDSTPGHFALDAHGAPKPDTAVGVIQRVARENPGFRATATFYLNKDMFGLKGAEAAAALKWLRQHGYDLGNHTLSHPNLGGMSAGAVRDEVGGLEDEVVKLTGAHTGTLAYPFGVAPEKEEWAREERGRYAFRGMFLAGWRPSPSPFAEEFDRWAIPRVRSEGKIRENDCKKYCSTAWLEYLDQHPQERYTSDGDPATVTIPRGMQDALAPQYRGMARVY
ncbi:polysaccharide deacetylase family protein [Actinomadura algeriensis]|uniref:Peptidoglycan/xylan/chitin deacetylase (PgdA/CDA1 family) n=1 Tax=Actinomadura algeriensis TaxID=1679523 RepID=A0ABR9JXR7_9ACTN|nr:polysaccharide deacetylase family protein [Actinomadura algeriensis]MBE1535362.1 peptidoglycan/xylan/chitin deacetylase (PgdA/CDA1 family) [Actinomadura algeriensis]